MTRKKTSSSDRLGGGIVRDSEIRPSLRRRVRVPTWRGRAPRGRLAALAVVSAVVVLPHASAARGPLVPPPVVTYTIDGIDGTNGWYRGNSGGNYVVVHWSVTGSITSTS